MVRKLDPEKRKKFLNAALKLFVANGVQHTSTAAIARDAGTAAGTLFLYFPTKQDLIHALILEITEESSEYIKAQLNPALSARDTFLTIWNGIIGWFMQNMAAYHYQQQVRGTRMIEEAVVEETAKYLDYYFEAIQKGHEEGAIKSYPPEVIGEILYQDIVAVMNIISTQPDPVKQKEYIQIGFDIFWDGIKTADE